MGTPVVDGRLGAGDGAAVRAVSGRRPCLLGSDPGGGSRGEVYPANRSAAPVAVNWAVPSGAGEQQHRAPQALSRRPAPGPAVLWPVDTVSTSEVAGSGYVMPLRDSRYRPMMDLIRQPTEATFRTLTTAGMWLAHRFLLLMECGPRRRGTGHGRAGTHPATGGRNPQRLRVGPGSRRAARRTHRVGARS